MWRKVKKKDVIVPVKTATEENVDHRTKAKENSKQQGRERRRKKRLESSLCKNFTQIR